MSPEGALGKCRSLWAEVSSGLSLLEPAGLVLGWNRIPTPPLNPKSFNPRPVMKRSARNTSTRRRRSSRWVFFIIWGGAAPACWLLLDQRRPQRAGRSAMGRWHLLCIDWVRARLHCVRSSPFEILGSHPDDYRFLHWSARLPNGYADQCLHPRQSVWQAGQLCHDT